MCNRETKFYFTAKEDIQLINQVSKFPSIFDSEHADYTNKRLKDDTWIQISEKIGRSVHDCKNRWRNIRDTYQRRKKKGKNDSMSHKWILAERLSFLDGTVINTRNSHVKECEVVVENANSMTGYDSDTHHKNNNSENNRISANTEIILVDVKGSSEVVEDMPNNTNEDVFIQMDSSDQAENDNFHKTFNRSLNRSSDFHSFNNSRDTLIANLLSPRLNESNDVLAKLLTKNQEDDVDLFFKSIASSVKKLRSDMINEAKLKILQTVIDLENRTSSSTKRS